MQLWFRLTMRTWNESPENEKRIAYGGEQRARTKRRREGRGEGGRGKGGAKERREATRDGPRLYYEVGAGQCDREQERREHDEGVLFRNRCPPLTARLTASGRVCSYGHRYRHRHHRLSSLAKISHSPTRPQPSPRPPRLQQARAQVRPPTHAEQAQYLSLRRNPSLDAPSPFSHDRRQLGRRRRVLHPSHFGSRARPTRVEPIRTYRHGRESRARIV